MRVLFGKPLLILLLCLFPFGCESLPDTPFPTRIIMLGDSITAGGHWQNWTGRGDVVNEGLAGNTSQRLLDRMDQLSWPPSVNLCFLMIGVNDIGGGIKEETILENVESILLKIQERNVKPVIQSVLLVAREYPDAEKINTQIMMVNEALEELAMREELVYLDLNEVLASEGFLISRFSQDGLHLVEEGYRLWINEIIPIINQYGV